MITIFFRTIIIYLLLLAVMRLMGKRAIGQLELSELVISIMLSELAVAPITDNNIPIAYALVPILTLISFEICFSFFEIKFPLAKKLLSGRPSYLINRGVLDQKELERVRLSLDELMSELRLKEVANIADVYYAILEKNGQLSVFQRSEPENGVMHPIIIDGRVISNNLTLIGQSQAWLLKQLGDRKCRLNEVFLFSLDDNGNVYFCKKEK